MYVFIYMGMDVRDLKEVLTMPEIDKVKDTDLDLNIDKYIYTHTHIYTHIYMYIHVYTHVCILYI